MCQTTPFGSAGGEESEKKLVEFVEENLPANRLGSQNMLPQQLTQSLS